MMLPGAVTMVPQYLIWRGTGLLGTWVPLFGMNLFGSAFYIFLQRQFFLGLPKELFEAARVDGAGAMDSFRRIILPLARPATVTVIILSLIGGLRSFDLIWAMTRGGPGFTSDVIASVIYKQYQAGFYGLSTAGNVVLFIVVAALILPLSAWLNRGEKES